MVTTFGLLFFVWPDAPIEITVSAKVSRVSCKLFRFLIGFIQSYFEVDSSSIVPEG